MELKKDGVVVAYSDIEKQVYEGSGVSTNVTLIYNAKNKTEIDEKFVLWIKAD